MWSRTRMGLRGSIRASFNTISIIEHRSLNAIARGRIPNKMQHGHRPPFLCNRIYYGAWTVVPLYADCYLFRVCSDAHRTLSLTGSWRRRVTVTPSRRRWNRGKRASVRGTSVRPRSRHIVCLERVPVRSTNTPYSYSVYTARILSKCLLRGS